MFLEAYIWTPDLPLTRWNCYRLATWLGQEGFEGAGGYDSDMTKLTKNIAKPEKMLNKSLLNNNLL